MNIQGPPFFSGSIPRINQSATSLCVRMPRVESSSPIFTQHKPREVLNMVPVETSESFARMGSGRLSGTFVSDDCASDRSGYSSFNLYMPNSNSIS